jgi:transcriptional regulator with XRE-family HTH domain
MPEQAQQTRIELKVERVRKGLSQQAAAEAMGFSRPIIMRAEKGQEIRLEYAQRMARFYGRSMDELFPFEGETAA